MSFFLADAKITEDKIISIRRNIHLKKTNVSISRVSFSIFYRIFKQCRSKSMTIHIMAAMNCMYIAILTNNFAVLRSAASNTGMRLFGRI